MSAVEVAAWQETAYRFRSPADARRLLNAYDRARTGKTVNVGSFGAPWANWGSRVASESDDRRCAGRVLGRHLDLASPMSEEKMRRGQSSLQPEPEVVVYCERACIELLRVHREPCAKRGEFRCRSGTVDRQKDDLTAFSCR